MDGFIGSIDTVEFDEGEADGVFLLDDDIGDVTEFFKKSSEVVLAGLNGRNNTLTSRLDT